VLRPPWGIASIEAPIVTVRAARSAALLTPDRAEACMSQSRSRVLARTFVRRIVQHVFADFLDLEEREGTDSSYKAIEDAVRRQNKIPSHDLLVLEDAVRQAIPEPHRDDVATALNILSNAYADELIVHKQTAYLVGVTVGQTFSPSMLPDAVLERPG
jgi:hypothetical protein